jgi:DNA mismatch endonuclease (patch repair protein)
MTRPPASSRQVRLRMQATGRRDTPCELAIRSAVHHLGLRFRVDWQLPGCRRRADMAFIQPKVAVMIDGCFWHSCPLHSTMPQANRAWWRAKLSANVRRDKDTDHRLAQLGWSVLRFWEHEDPGKAANRIARVVRLRQSRAADKSGAGRDKPSRLAR